MRCGHVTHVTACPVGYSEMPDMTSEDIDKLASKALKRRTNLSWESFNEFYDDVHSICFLETIEVNGEISFECSCVIGLKGMIELNLNDFASNFRFLIR